MKLCVEHSDRTGCAGKRSGAIQGFTLIETALTMALLVLLCVGTLGTILQMQVSSKRTADYTSAMAIAEAKLLDIRGVYYNPSATGSNFNYGTIYITNQDSIALNKAGTTFEIPGTVVSKIEYQGRIGSLVTVTATFQTSGKPMTATLQSVVNSYSGGVQ
jgi:type II secretory pathway pseudopilin PulG